MQYILAVIIVLVLLFLYSNCGRNIPPFIGAMCYKVVVAPQRTEYVCPICGEKTLYSLESSVHSKNNASDNQKTLIFLANGLDNCRRQVRQITKLSVQLDESQFCKKCSPDIQIPQLILVIRFPGEQQEYRYPGVTSSSLYQLIEFLNTKEDCNDLSAGRIKSADCLEQINTILGSKQL